MSVIYINVDLWLIRQGTVRADLVLEWRSTNQSSRQEFVELRDADTWLVLRLSIWSTNVPCRYAELLYNGLWFSPERRALQAAIDETQKFNTGTVRLKLYKVKRLSHLTWFPTYARNLQISLLKIARKQSVQVLQTVVAQHQSENWGWFLHIP